MAVFGLHSKSYTHAVNPLHISWSELTTLQDSYSRRFQNLPRVWVLTKEVTPLYDH